MSPYPAPTPVNEPHFSSTAPANGDTWIWNAGTGQWEPGAGGGGGADLTDWTGKRVEGAGAPAPNGIDHVPTFFDPASTVYTDRGWWQVEYQSADISINWMFGDMSAPNAAWGNLQSFQDQAVVYIAQFNLNAFLQLTINPNEASLTGQAAAGQTNPIIDLRDENGVSQLRATQTGRLGINGVTPPAQSAHGTTAADAIACLVAHGLMHA